MNAHRARYGIGALFRPAAVGLSLLLGSAGAQAAVLWSEIAWRIGPDDCIRVPASLTLVIDGDALLGRLHVEGTVEFEDLGPRSLEASEIEVTGELNAGTAASPFVNDLEIRLVEAADCTTERRIAELHIPVPGTFPLEHQRFVLLLSVPGTFPSIGAEQERTLRVLDDGQLRLYGSDPGLTWTTLTTTATGTAMQVPAGTGWQIGDRVVLAPTDFAHDEAEEVGLLLGPTVAAGEETWDLDAALTYEHHAEAVDEVPVFGEVGHLTRNIRVFSPSPTRVAQAKRDCSDGGYSGRYLQFNGAEIIIERPNGGTANAVLEFIEVYNAGKFDRLTHYPIHYHMLGDGTGGRVHGVSVHTSANRGIVVHGTTDLDVTDSVVYDVVGHGYYLEEASPMMPTIRNRLEGNLAVQVHGCPRQDDVDPDVVFANDFNTSGFFFTDPRNALIDNHAAGALHAGFWWDGGNDFNGYNLCGGRALHLGGVESEPLDTALFADTTNYQSAAVYADAELDTTCHGAFVGNTAHSAIKGLWAEQHKDQLVRFTDFTTYKNTARALELKNHGVTEIYGLMASDSPSTLWPATHAFHVNARPRVLLVDSVVQGESPARTVSYPLGLASIPFYGIEVYEGRLDVARTAFYNFDDSDPAVGKRAAFGRHQSFPFYSNNPDNAIEAITFGPNANPLYFDDPTTETRANQPSATIDGASGFQTVMLRDLDGDITGVPGQWIVANDEFNVPASASGSEAVYDAVANAWFIDDTVWEQGQLLVEWCAESVTEPPQLAGAERCVWSDSANEATPARRWDLVNANGDHFDIVEEVRFVDLDDCLAPGCADEIDALHHQPQGNHNIAAANVRTPGWYDISFYDDGGVELDDANGDFDDVGAIHVHLRSAPPGAFINVEVSVPDLPDCVVRYDAMDMPLGGHQTMQLLTSGKPSTPDEWAYDAGKVSLLLEHGADEQSVLMVFDPLVTCPS